MRPPRSTELLARIVQDGTLPLLEIARAVDCTDAELIDFVAGTKLMLPAKQLALAELVLERCPALRRTAATLRAQATAAVALERRVISSQAQPVGWRSMRQGR